MFSPAGRGDGMVAARNLPCLAWVHRQPSPHPTYNRSCESIESALRLDHGRATIVCGTCVPAFCSWRVTLACV